MLCELCNNGAADNNVQNVGQERARPTGSIEPCDANTTWPSISSEAAQKHGSSKEFRLDMTSEFQQHVILTIGPRNTDRISH